MDSLPTRVKIRLVEGKRNVIAITDNRYGEGSFTENVTEHFQVSHFFLSSPRHV